ncbi:MAG: YybH family protein [Gemmatimonadota bacterium]
MKFRPALAALALVGLAAAACSREAGEATTDSTIEMAAPSAEVSALNALTTSFAERYNAHDPAAVADFYTDDALTLSADGSVNEGREAITASLERAMAASPTLELTTDDVKVFEQGAVARGHYGVQVTPEDGEPLAWTGSYMTVFTRPDDEWKISLVITNYDSPPPEGVATAEGPSEAPEEAGAMGDLISAYQEHFNLGHAAMVADLYTEDAVAAFANQPVAEGRDAIESALAESYAPGSPQLEIHDVGTLDLGEGWKLDGGWYRLTATTDAAAAPQVGSYVILCQQAEDGNWKIQWAVSNGHPAEAAGG